MSHTNKLCGAWTSPCARYYTLKLYFIAVQFISGNQFNNCGNLRSSEPLDCAPRGAVTISVFMLHVLCALLVNDRNSQEKQKAARDRKQRMLGMEVEAKAKALKSDIEVVCQSRDGFIKNTPEYMYET